ncbi:MAG: hypothetical protein Q9M28_03265 [Mariprofundaceae bacterium]|nr:hypothetical protein [Mariprofundaceae bacterium]
MKETRPLPSTPAQWLHEMMEAFQDAKHAMPTDTSTQVEASEGDLFHMAPLVCLKFRGMAFSESNRKIATDAALSSYLANEEANGGLLKNPIMAFFFCYILAHYGLECIKEETCQQLLNFVELNLESIEEDLALLSQKNNH